MTAMGIAMVVAVFVMTLSIAQGFQSTLVASGSPQNTIIMRKGATSENVSAILQVITFFVFGALIVATGYDGELWRLALFIVFALVLARPLAIAIAFLRERLPGPQKAFIAWFGPKGVASILFALLVVDSDAAGRGVIFDVAAFVVLASIVAHGLTDTLGTRWIERRM